MTHMKKLAKDKLLAFTEYSLENQLKHLEVTTEGKKQALAVLRYFYIDMCQWSLGTEYSAEYL